MISVFANGFIGRKPELLLVGTNRRQKVEFDVISERREKDRASGEWVSVYERATFVAWDEEAMQIAERFDKGTELTCVGTQRTSKWKPPDGPERTFVKYDLDRWEIIRRRPANVAEGGQQHQQRPPAPTGAGPQQSRSHQQDDAGRRHDGPVDTGPLDDEPFPGSGGAPQASPGRQGERGEARFIEM